MVIKFFRPAWQYITHKTRVEKFTARFSDTPKLVRILNVALPAGMIVAVVFGTAVAAWQIASLAHQGEVSIVLPKADPDITADFPVEVIFDAAQDRQPFNLVFKLIERVDGNDVEYVIASKVGSAMGKDDQPRPYVFRSGINGVNLFDRNLLRPGNHTIKVEAKTGTTVGQGAPIDTAKVEFKVKNVKNIVAFGEGAKTFSATQLPLDGGANPRNTSNNLPNFLDKKLADLPALLLPKASAHTGTGKRHGDLNVNADPGVSVTVGHIGGALDGCHSGNTQAAAADGIARFRDCAVTNNYQSPPDNEATYKVTVGPTPPGRTLNDPHDKNVTVRWNATASVGFNYAASANPNPAPPAPGPTPTPPPDTTPSYDYKPANGPLIAVTKLTATTAEADAFAYQMVDNNPLNYLQEVSADVDGNRVSTRTDMNEHATHASVTLNLPNLKDGKPHELVIRAINKSGMISNINISITPDNGTGGAPGPANPGGSTPNNPPPPPPPPAGAEDGGNGRIKVTTRVFKDGDAKDRIGNSEVVVQAKDHPVNQVVNGKLLNCNPHTKTTNTDKNNEDGYGRANFDGCWTSSDKKQTYTLKQISPPNGYNVRSIHLPSQPGKSFDEKVEFEVKDGQETAVEIWLNPPGVTTGGGGGSGGGGRPVVAPPAPVANLRVNETAPGIVKLEWNGVPGASGYVVDKLDLAPADPASPWEEDFGDNSNEDDNGNPITPATTLEDDEAGIAIRNVYRVATYKEVEDEDPIKSAYVQVEITTAPLGAPTNLVLSQPAPASVKLQWQAPASPIPGYSIQKSLDGTTWEEISTNDNTNEAGNTITPSTSYTDEGDDVGYSIRYLYRVASSDDEGGLSAFANAEITTAPVPAPTDLKLKETGPAVVQLDWQTPANIGDADISYTIERSVDQTTWEKRGEDIDEVAYTDLQGLFSTRYFYRIAAKIGESSSAYLAADITTSAFVPNITPTAVDDSEDAEEPEEPDEPEEPEEEPTDDELDEAENYEEAEGTDLSDDTGESDMEAFIPENSLKTAASCDVVKVDGRDSEITSDVTPVGDPAALVCKTADGSLVDSFDKSVVLIFGSDSENAEDKQIFSLAASKVLGSRLKAGGGAGSRVITTTKKPGVFVLVDPAQKKGLSAFYVIAGATAVLIGAATAWVVIRYRMEAKFSAPPDPDI